MKKLPVIFLALFIITTVVSTSCVKKANPPAPKVDTAGVGGTTTLIIFPQHHYYSWPIDSCTVYIKYNAIDAPANNLYDDSAKCICADSIASCTFTNLKNGNYYLYGRGYDTNVHYRIAGGGGVTIATQNTSISSDLAITEY